VAKKINFFDDKLKYCCDRDFWYKMGKIGKLYNFPEYFMYYLMSGENTSIAKIKPHLKSSLLVMMRYKNDYPNYYLAFVFNTLQYLYAFLPVFLRKLIHRYAARLKKIIFK
jgi:hypothetical protein